MAHPTVHVATSPVAACTTCGQMPAAGHHRAAVRTTRLVLVVEHAKTTSVDDVATDVMLAMSAIDGVTLTQEPLVLP